MPDQLRSQGSEVAGSPYSLGSSRVALVRLLLLLTASLAFFSASLPISLETHQLAIGSSPAGRDLGGGLFSSSFIRFRMDRFLPEGLRLRRCHRRWNQISEHAEVAFCAVVFGGTYRIRTS